jgi:CRP/FNR family transcriptional regulator
VKRVDDFSCEDALTYLPRKPLHEFSRDRVIYGPQQTSENLYVVIMGRVKISSTAEDGCQTVSRIVRSEGLFGESCLVGSMARSETATALEAVSVMCWTRAEIESYIEREPRLGVALAQHLVRQCIALQDRIESMAVHKTPERVMLAFIQLSEALGTAMADGSSRITALTHHTIAEYVGTSREIVTFQMNRLRRVGLLRYSRKHIDIYAQAMAESLRQVGVGVPRAQPGLAVPAAG